MAATALRRAVRLGALAVMLVLLPACSELAQPSEAMDRMNLAPAAQPPYVALAAKHLLAALKDHASYDGFEISPLRWVHSIDGWSWLACVHFRDRGHRRSYAILIQNNAVVDARYAVETDACESQVFTQFDVMTGELGRPTVWAQPPLY